MIIDFARSWNRRRDAVDYVVEGQFVHIDDDVGHRGVERRPFLR